MSNENAQGPGGGHAAPNHPTAKRSEANGNTATREVKFRHSAQFVPILEHLGCSLLISTYAAGKVVSVGTKSGSLQLGFSNFQHAMGIATSRPELKGKNHAASSLVVGGPNLIWMLRDAGQLAPRVEPPGNYDRAFLARESFVTGNIHIHEIRWGNDGNLWMVNTLFSCLCTLHDEFNFLPRWQPPFISQLAPEDRCHMNGMAMQNGMPKYVSALGESDKARGWRDNKSDGGVVVDIESNEVVARGFCMPHSPRIQNGRLFLLDSGRGRLVTIDPSDGNVTEVADYPGYGRGMALTDQFAFIGMSKARETSVFGGVPICEKPQEMRCGVVVVDLMKGKSVAFLEFESGVEELFEVQVIPGSRNTVICGPYPKEDGQPPVWVVPPPAQVENIVKLSTHEGVSRRQIR